MHQLQGHLADRELQFAEAKRQQIQRQEDEDLERMRNSLKPTSSRTENTYHHSSLGYQVCYIHDFYLQEDKMIILF